MYTELLRRLGIEVLIPVSEGYAWGAVEAFFHAYDPNTMVSARVDFHPNFTVARDFAAARGVETDFQPGSSCLIIANDLGGYKPVESVIGLREREVRVSRVSLHGSLFDRTANYGWFAPKAVGMRLPDTVLMWIRKNCEGLTIPIGMATLMQMCPLERRYVPADTFVWLSRMWEATSFYAESHRFVDETMQFLLGLYRVVSFYETVEGWPIAVGWSIRLEGYVKAEIYDRRALRYLIH